MDDVPFNIIQMKQKVFMATCTRRYCERPAAVCAGESSNRSSLTEIPSKWAGVQGDSAAAIPHHNEVGVCSRGGWIETRKR